MTRAKAGALPIVLDAEVAPDGEAVDVGARTTKASLRTPVRAYVLRTDAVARTTNRDRARGR